MSPQDTTRGVTVSMSAFLACHQCYCAGLSLTLGLESSGFSMWHFLKHFRMAAGKSVYADGSVRYALSIAKTTMWHFLKLVARGFLQVLLFPPLLKSVNGSANRIKLK